MNDARLAQVLAAIDDANALDPHPVWFEGIEQPAALTYGKQMSAWLEKIEPDASEHLRVSARGQHIERWTVPRSSFPEGQVGYLRWRTELKEFHARRLGDLMQTAQYEEADVDYVGALVRKERIKSDPVAQMLEDVVCIVFLDHYLEEFMAKKDDAKLARILAKTWQKMSPKGHAQAQKLDLPPKAVDLLEGGLKSLSRTEPVTPSAIPT